MQTADQPEATSPITQAEGSGNEATQHESTQQASVSPDSAAKISGVSPYSYSDALRRHAKGNHRNTSRSVTPRHRQTPDRNNSHIIQGKGDGCGLRAMRKSFSSSQKQRQCVGVFISRLARSSTPQDVVAHVKRETGLSVRCEALKTKYDSYCSFCVRVPHHDLVKLMNPFVWPSGSIVRKFFEHK